MTAHTGQDGIDGVEQDMLHHVLVGMQTGGLLSQVTHQPVDVQTPLFTPTGQVLAARRERHLQR